MGTHGQELLPETTLFSIAIPFEASLHHKPGEAGILGTWRRERVVLCEPYVTKRVRMNLEKHPGVRDKPDDNDPRDFIVDLGRYYKQGRGVVAEAYPYDEAGTVYSRPVRFFNRGNEPSFTTPNLLQRDPKWYVRSNQMGLGSLRDFRSAEPELSVDAHVHRPWDVEDLSTGRVTKVVKISGCNACEEVMRVTLRNYLKTDPGSSLRSMIIAMARWRPARKKETPRHSFMNIKLTSPILGYPSTLIATS
ncbi:putative Ste ste11 kinase [Seiridium cardinale]